MSRYLLAAGLAAVAWALTLSLYVAVALLTGHPLNLWLIIAAEPACIILWLATAKVLR